MKRIVLVLMSILSLTIASAQTSIKVNVHNVVEVGEDFSVTFVVDGKVDARDFQWTSDENFEILWGPQYGHSSSTSYVNGKRTSSSQTSFTYLVSCSKAGTYTLPSAVLTLKRKTLTSEPVEIEVVEVSGPDAAAETATEDRGRNESVSSNRLFMQFVTDKQRVMVGEPVHASLKLYSKVDIAGFSGFTLPDFNGFWKKETKSPQYNNVSREKFNGEIWDAATICEYVLIPQQSGTLTIGPSELVCMVNVREDTRGMSELDLFFSSGYKTLEKRLRTKPLKIQVSALPQPAPALFTGGVGRFDISARLQKDSLEVNEASTLTVIVKGKGNISLMGQPVVSFPLDFEAYDVKTSEKSGKDGLSGEKIYEFPFIPRSAGDFEIPAIGLSYYDSARHQYVTVDTGALPIHVEKGEGTEVLSGSSGPDVVKSFSQDQVSNLNTDIRYIVRESSRFSPAGSFFLGSPLFWGLFGSMTLIAVLVALIFRFLMHRRADVVHMKTRKASKKALKRLVGARKFLQQGNRSGFYEEMHKALLGFVADRMNVPYGELSGDRIGTLLQEHGAKPESCQEFLDLLDACEFARYAPSHDAKDMAAHYKTAGEIISVLDAEIGKIKSSAMKNTMLALLLMLAPFWANGMEQAEADSLWSAANSAYTAGEWQKAVDLYLPIEEAGLESPALYYNIANAYYKGGDLTSAILYYNRALRLDPSMEDAAYNLKLANSRIRDRIEPVPEFIFKVWMRDFCYVMDGNAWTALFLVLFMVTLVMVLLYLLSASTSARKTGFFTGIVTLLLSLFCLWMAFWQKSDYEDNKDAIVTTPVISVKSSPSADQSTELFRLHEGTKVEVLQDEEDWFEIRLMDGRQGWLLKKQIMTVN